MPDLLAIHGAPSSASAELHGASSAYGTERFFNPGSLATGTAINAPASVYVAPLLASGFSEWPTVILLARFWDEQMGWRLTNLSATSLRITFSPVAEVDVVPSVVTALDDLTTWTDLPTEKLAHVLGASRRSIYNWRRGATVPSDTAARILRAHESLCPLARRRPPAVVRSWLTEGDPSPGELVREQRWSDFQQAVDAEVEALTARHLSAGELDDRQSEPVAFSHETQQQLLERFRSRPDLAPRRTDWTPREVTGLGEEETDDM